jgi:hypothetical protein
MTLAIFAITCAAATAQAPNAALTQPVLGSISGKVLDETSKAVQGSVVMASKGQVLRTETPIDGSFSFPNLRIGTYVLCFHPAAADPKATARPLVDSCAWQDQSSLVIRLAPGEDRTNVTVPALHGYFLTVRVNDPRKALAAPIGGKLAANDISIMVVGPSGLPQPIPVVAQDAAGRDHQIVLRYATPHKVLAYSSAFSLSDTGGKSLDASQPVSLNVASGEPTRLWR